MSSSDTYPPADCLWQQGFISGSALPCLEGEHTCDVAIVGGGFTGLWTALFLKRLKPELDVRVIEARHCGHGASGRNGGWLMGSLEGLEHFATANGQLAKDVRQVLATLVSDAATALESLNVDCDLTHGGGLFAAARYPQQLSRARGMFSGLKALGFSGNDYRWLTAREAGQRVAAARLSGAIFTPHVATVNPWKLVRGLRDVAVTHDIPVYEQSRVTRFDVGRGANKALDTADGNLRANWIVLATEGYSERGNPLHNYLLPVQSGMVATEPLSAHQWQSIGFRQREAFSDFSRASTYLQRSADNRLVVGARGTYRLGRRCQHEMVSPEMQTRHRIALAKALFPVLKEVRFTHAWSGTLGIPRRFAPHLIVDRQHQIATSGGYVGEGVGASFLFGQTVAELIAGEDSQRTRMPWVNTGRIEKTLKRWEPEPLPWLGFNATMTAFDLEETILSTLRHP